jgi:hypothetical protein
MKTTSRTLSIILSFVAAAFVAGLLRWLFSLEGTKGLAEWDIGAVFVAAAALGLLPLVLTLAGLPFLRTAGSKAGSLLAALALGLSCLAIAGSALVFGVIYAKAHAMSGPVPALNLVDPSKGIRPADQGGAAEGKGSATLGAPVLRLALSSDPHWGAAKSDARARSAVLASVARSRPRPDAFFILGDNVQIGMDAGQWAAEAADLAAGLGDLPLRSLLGNHDAIADGQYHYERYFFPKGLTSDTGSPFYYSIDAGPALLVVLDLLWGAEDFDAERRAWLERTLAAVPPEKRIIVLTHCFFASSGYMDGSLPWFDHYGTLAAVAPILERYRVDLVLQGHNHYMEFLERNGVSYATIGAMGGKPDPEPTHVSPWSKWFLRGSFGYATLEARRAGLSLSFRDQDGSVLKTFLVPATR